MILTALEIWAWNCSAQESRKAVVWVNPEKVMMVKEEEGRVWLVMSDGTMFQCEGTMSQVVRALNIALVDRVQ